MLCARIDGWTPVATVTFCHVTRRIPRLLRKYKELQPEDHVMEEREELCHMPAESAGVCRPCYPISVLMFRASCHTNITLAAQKECHVNHFV